MDIGDIKGGFMVSWGLYRLIINDVLSEIADTIWMKNFVFMTGLILHSQKQSSTSKVEKNPMKQLDLQAAKCMSYFFSNFQNVKVC